MIPEYGQFALIIALILSVLLASVPMLGSLTGRLLWMNSARSLSVGMFTFTAIAFAVLVYCFVTDDFTVKYVASNSNTLLPTVYKVTAVWGGHEGSILLWALVLTIWTLAVAIFSKDLPVEILSRVLSVMGFITVGFLLFILLTSNPFDRLLPNPVADGSDLNPMLQDFGMIIHPPMLYMGYVGFSVCFAFAIAALIGGRLDSSWARWSRPWTNMAWAFQSLGIMLGSWWAYYELGWGGWWFWDPVENASFMPWIVGTALIHSLAVTEKRGVFKSWTILLAIVAFSLSLLGTFIVRSGVLTSVHAFATDPERGMFILGFLAVVVGGSFTLYAFRIPEIRSVQGFAFLSRETFLLINNILLVVSCAIVLFGTLSPIVADLFWGLKLSVGPPWFNAFYVPMMAVLAVFLGVGSTLNWKKTNHQKLIPWLLAPLAGSVVLGLLLPMIGDTYDWRVALAIFLGCWITLSAFSDMWRKVRHSKTLWSGLSKLTPSYYGMIIAHIGFAFTLVGVTVDTIHKDERDLRMAYGERQTIGGHEFELVDVVAKRGPNYDAMVAEVKVFKEDELILTLFPEKRTYLAGQQMVMTEPGINPGFTRDLFVALGDKLGHQAWSMRINYFPLVRWIWLGAILMAVGGTLAVLDKRYRVRKKTAEESAPRSTVTQSNENSSEGKTA